MGYTHYWDLANLDPMAYKMALADCKAIIAASPVPLAGVAGEGAPEVGAGICFNGRAPDDDHEPFDLLPDPTGGFTFCKTAHKPYDVVVVACLCALEDRMGPGARVRSDGGPEDWAAGVALARRVLHRDIRLPASVCGDVKEG